MTDNKSAPQPIKKIKLYVGTAVLIAVVTYLQMNVWAGIPEITGPAIPFDHLSSEETEPYLVSGKPPELKADIRAAKKWPDARSCLIKTEHEKEIPDLRLINWKKMKKETDIKVCMFRIANSLGTPGKVKSWLEAHGLKARIWKSITQHISTPLAVQAWHTVSMDTRVLVPPVGIKNITLSITAHTESFSISWGRAGAIYETGHSYSVE